MAYNLQAGCTFCQRQGAQRHQSKQWKANSTEHGHSLTDRVSTNVKRVDSLSIPIWATRTPTGHSWDPSQSSSLAISIGVMTTAGTSTDGSTSAATVTMTTRPNKGSHLPSQTRTILVSSSWPAPTSTPTALLPNRPEKSDSWAQTDIGIFLLSLLSLLFFGALSAAIHHFWVKARLTKKLRQLRPLPLPPPPAPAQYEPVLVPSSAMTSGTTPVGNTVRYDLENRGERERTTPLPDEPELSVDEPNTGAATAIPMKLIKEDRMEFGFGRNARCLSPSSMVRSEPAPSPSPPREHRARSHRLLLPHTPLAQVPEDLETGTVSHEG
ncbi:hypothetical protein FRC14_006805 [Serendipita sp. 396]|nr:hypothetical protein FRC14_006805 [Serendipita sp. 396]KAG8778056.1 hypothetical protein FRC15_010982 [Serendipita sp. 397]KAG8795368.1 hypothetical protein FRC16_010103 [Serendipita sp. 398]KAG8863661.1 hypothetical protein FRC20_010592 [Serendipita sp. 405]